MPITNNGFGYGGLGAVGYGYGGGGTGYGSIGTASYGSGAGRGLVAHSAFAPLIRAAPPIVMGMLSPETIRSSVLRNIGQVRMCYQNALQRNPTLEGRVTLRFVIGVDGSMLAAAVSESTLPDPSVGECIAAAARRWILPAPPDGSIITVNYPFTFTAGEPAPSPTRFDVPRDL
jgi:TonB family protein